MKRLYTIPHSVMGILYSISFCYLEFDNNNSEIIMGFVLKSVSNNMQYNYEDILNSDPEVIDLLRTFQGHMSPFAILDETATINTSRISTGGRFGVARCVSPIWGLSKYQFIINT